MKYRLEDIEAFLAVVETGSITAAAVRLDVAKSVVSKRVAALEDALGVQLLQRSTRKASPTSEGLQFFERGKSAMQELEEAAHSASGLRRGFFGTVRLSLPMSFGRMWAIPALLPFVANNRELTVQMDLDDRYIDLVQDGYDLAIRIGVLADSSLFARKLADSRRVLCCSPAYLAGRTPPRTIEDLARHESIGYTLTASSHIWQFERDDPASSGRSGPKFATTLRARVVTNNGEAMMQAALAGHGLTILPSFIVMPSLRAGALQELKLDGLRPTSDTVNAVYTRARNLSSKVRAIIDHLADAWAGDSPPWDRP